MFLFSFLFAKKKNYSEHLNSKCCFLLFLENLEKESRSYMGTLWTLSESQKKTFDKGTIKEASSTICHKDTAAGLHLSHQTMPRVLSLKLGVQGSLTKTTCFSSGPRVLAPFHSVYI